MLLGAGLSFEVISGRGIRSVGTLEDDTRTGLGGIDLVR